MYETISAVYEDRVLRPTSPLVGLTNGQKVTITLFDDEELIMREKEFAL